MNIDIQHNLKKLRDSIPTNVCLLAVSKTKPIELLQLAYDAGQRDFGENKVQELRDKQAVLAQDIRWHMIGHLQSNKVKYIAPFIYMIHAVDSLKLLKEINKRALENKRTIKVLLQVYVAKEETKFGFDPEEILDLFNLKKLDDFQNICFAGLMAMATNTDNSDQIRKEFRIVKDLLLHIQKTYPSFDEFKELSIGMSNDYQLAIEEGSTMIRIGSSIFGSR
jgi:pyridoxal phosphate enzyme (YggS family)